MEKIKEIKENADYLRLSLMRNQAERFIHQAQIDKPSYLDYTHDILDQEVRQRQKNDMERRIKLAHLPKDHNLDLYDPNFASGMNKNQLQELRELLWLEQAYNIILMGPSGIGKTYIAAGLVHDAINQGYRAYFTGMEDLITVLKMKEMTSS